MCRLSCGRGGQIIENPTSSRTSCVKKFMPTHVEVSSSRPTAAPSNTDHISEIAHPAHSPILAQPHHTPTLKRLSKEGKRRRGRLCWRHALASADVRMSTRPAMTALALAPPPRPLKETSPAAPCVAATFLGEILVCLCCLINKCKIANFNLHAPQGPHQTVATQLLSQTPSSVEVTSLTGTHSRREIEIEAPPSSNRSHGGGALQADLGAHAAKPSPGRNSAPHQLLGLLDQQHPLRDRPRPSVGCALRTRRPAFAMGWGPST